jgi:hypothetical protein
MVTIRRDPRRSPARRPLIETNRPGDPQGLYDEVDRQRGEMENRIEEQQSDLFADRTGCRRFPANQFRLLLCSAAYLLVRPLRRTALMGTKLARAQVGAIRLRLFKVAARAVTSARRLVFHLARSYPRPRSERRWSMYRRPKGG